MLFESDRNRALFYKVLFWSLLACSFFILFAMVLDMVMKDWGMGGSGLLRSPRGPGVDWLAMLQPLTMIGASVLALIMARQVPEVLAPLPPRDGSGWQWGTDRRQRWFYGMLLLMAVGMLFEPVRIVMTGASWLDEVARLRAQRTLSDLAWHEWVPAAMVVTGMVGAWWCRPDWARPRWLRWW